MNNQTSSDNTPSSELKGIKEMPLMDHIRELRKRLFISIIVCLIASVISYEQANNIFNLLCQPYFEYFPGSLLIGTGPADAFLIKLKISFFSGIILSSPIIFYQIWLFVAPGLLDHEKSLVFPFLITSTALFLTGIWFCYYIVLPFTFEFFYEQYDSIKLTPTVRITEHLSFMATSILSFGVVFELPILAYFLGRLGIINSKMLTGGMRYAIVIIFAVAAIMTPPDVLTQFLMAGPLLLLYGLSILVVKFTEKNNSNSS
ncbi:MAG: twin-arginine translocase subunit TatC [bacterium]|mgnify:CR=1 FL=1|nr:twin-arginine translocase subunit TatC [bacterium]